MRGVLYPGYDFVTNFNKKSLTQVLLCARLSGLTDYYIDENAYDSYGNRLEDMSVLAVRDAASQKFEIHKFFQYNNELSLRLEENLKKNGILPKDYTPWTHDLPLYLGCEKELSPGKELKYYPRRKKT